MPDRLNSIISADLHLELEQLARDEMTEFRETQKARALQSQPEADAKNVLSDVDTDFQHLRRHRAHDSKIIASVGEDQSLREQADHHLAVEGRVRQYTIGLPNW